MNIGLLSTAKDFDLVGEVLIKMGMDSSKKEVTAITTAGNKDGRSKNTFADRALAALSHNGFTTITEVDVQGVESEQVMEQLAPGESGKAQLLVITGGDKRYLKEQLDASCAGRIIQRNVTSGEVAIATISAGTTLMGTTIEASGADALCRPSGLQIVPAVVICHFNEEKERDTLQKISRALWGANTVVGIRDDQALVGKRGDDLSIVGEGFSTILRKGIPGDTYKKTITKRVNLPGY